MHAASGQYGAGVSHENLAHRCIRYHNDRDVTGNGRPEENFLLSGRLGCNLARHRSGTKIAG